MIQFVKTNALLLLLLAITIYQHSILLKLREMAYHNDESIVETHNRVVGVELELEEVAFNVRETNQNVLFLLTR